MTTQKHLFDEDDSLKTPQQEVADAVNADVADDFELPAKACDIGRPEGCESCQ